jgi:hypothetical protein
MPMTNMKSEPELEEMPGMPEPDEPAYPEGLKIELETDELDKLGVASMPALGTRVRIEAEGVVVCTSTEMTQGGTERCMSIQITDMNLSVGGSSARNLLS